MVRQRRSAFVAGIEKIIDDAEFGVGFSQTARSVKDFVASGRKRNARQLRQSKHRKRLAMQ